MQYSYASSDSDEKLDAGTNPKEYSEDDIF